MARYPIAGLTCASRSSIDVSLVPVTGADATQRAEMLDLAIAGEPGLVVDRRELRRAGPSYSVDTLGELRAELGSNTPIAWLVGADSLRQLHTWHRWQELFERALAAVCHSGDAVALEHLSAIKRAGADIVLTYFTRWFAEAVASGELVP